MLRPIVGLTLACACASLLLFGCGGGGGVGSSSSGSGGSGTGGGGGGDTGGSGTAITGLTTKFHVDVASGKVTVVSGKPVSDRAVFSGTAVGFNSSVLLDQSGDDNGLKTLNVSVTNNWGLPIGVDPNGTVSGLKVVFGPFVNLSGSPVISNLTNVTSYAGTGVAGTTDGSLGAASFNLPGGVVSGGSGVYYVSDAATNLIRKMSNGQVSTLAGGGVSGANGTGKAAGFSNPYGLAINPMDGSIIIAENGGNRIRRMTPGGSVSTIAGTGTASTTNGPGTTATFNKPYGVAVDNAGNIYVADFTGRMIREINFTGGDPTNPANYQVNTLAGTGASGSIDGPGSTATFIDPAGICFDSANSVLYVADAGLNRIRRVDLNGNVTTVAGTGASGETDGNGTIATFKTPRGIALVQGALIVSTGSGCDIRQVTLTPGASPNLSASWTVQTLAGTGTAGANDGSGTVATFNTPLLLGADASGNILVPDSVNNKIRMVRPTNGFFPVGTPNGSTTFENVQLSNPTGFVGVPGTGIDSPYISYAGSLASGASTAAQPWNFVIPNGVNAFEFTVTVDADTANMSAPNGTGTGSVGSANDVVKTIAGGLSADLVDGFGTQARFDGPFQIAQDPSGAIYVCDNLNDALRRIGPDGRTTTIIGGGTPGFVDGPAPTATMGSPKGVAVSPDGTEVYVADGQRIRLVYRFAGSDASLSSSWTVVTIAGGSTAGNTNGFGTAAQFNSPWALALAPGGTLYVAEFGGNRIRRMQALTGPHTAPSSWLVNDYAGDPGASSGDLDSFGVVARFSGPEGIAVDQIGNLYVAEAGNHRIRKISVDTQVTTIAGGVSNDTPVSGFVNGPGASARFNTPTGIAVDSAGYLYVCDYNNERIRRVSPGGIVSTVIGNGVAARTDGPGNLATLGGARGIVVTPSGNIIFSDNSNCLIREIELNVTAGTQ